MNNDIEKQIEEIRFKHLYEQDQSEGYLKLKGSSMIKWKEYEKEIADLIKSQREDAVRERDKEIRANILRLAREGKYVAYETGHKNGLFKEWIVSNLVFESHQSKEKGDSDVRQR